MNGIRRWRSCLVFLPNRAFSLNVMFQPTYVEKLFADDAVREQGFVDRMRAVKPASLAGTRLRLVDEAEPNASATTSNSITRRCLALSEPRRRPIRTRRICGSSAGAPSHSLAMRGAVLAVL
jgi:hypothetical protein